MRICTLSIALLSLLLSATGTGRCDGIRVKYLLQPPSIVNTVGGYSVISFNGGIQAGRPGSPSYPYLGASVLLPSGEEAVDVRVVRRGYREIPGRVRLHPRQFSRPGADMPGADHLFVRPEAYTRDVSAAPPDGRFTTRFFRGHPVATGSFSPVTYNPATGKAGYYSEIELVVSTASGRAAAAARRFLRTDAGTLSRLAAIVDNPGDIGPGVDAGNSLPSGEAAPGGCGAGYGLLVITVEELAGEFEVLREFYERRGTPTTVLTVEEITASWPGADTQERIRNAVIDHYTMEGIGHLLLAGDGDPGGIATVPYRGLYCAVQSSTLYEDSDIPSDIYYAALDGDWNGDGDALWGEPGEDDLFCEISVGRMPVDSRAEASAMISKTMMYQESPVTGDSRSALMLGEHLWSDPETWGGDELDQLIGLCDEWGFVTDGIPADFYISRYYDRDLGSWPASTVWAEADSGTAWICHAGHSNYLYAMGMHISDVDTVNFTNDGITAGYPVVYTYGCYAGAFDRDDCIAEQMVTIETFAAAALCHSRYGWFTEGTTNGPSHHLQREFFDAVFGEGFTRLGEALSRARDESVPFLDLPEEYEPGAHRWCFYCLNLLGDPAMDAWTGAITPLGADHPASIGREDSLFYAETSLEGVTAALYSEGSLLGSAISGPDGRIAIPLCAAVPDTADTVVLTLTAHDMSYYREMLPVVETTGAGTPPATVSLGRISPNPFNPSATVTFELPSRCEVDLSAYSVDGRLVSRLAGGQMEAGPHSVTWRPARLASGVYLLVLRAGGSVMARKAVLLR